jgi:pSer/pThr/pTyr-binding forkhead associated (FHA) protein
VSRGIDPEIDLTGPPADPGVSRLHAMLIEAADGTWSVVDPGSENGTLVNGKEIPPGEAVPLRDGDRIHLGAWTALTITRG